MRLDRTRSRCCRPTRRPRSSPRSAPSPSSAARTPRSSSWSTCRRRGPRAPAELDHAAADAERARSQPAPTRRAEDEALSVDELRDAWPLLDLEERSDGLRVLPREDAEEFFIALPAHDQAQLRPPLPPGPAPAVDAHARARRRRRRDPGRRRRAQADAARAARRSDAQGSPRAARLRRGRGRRPHVDALRAAAPAR